MKLISRLLIALTLLGTGNLALADQGHRDHDRRGQSQGDRDHQRDHRHDNGHDGRGHDSRHHHDRRYGYRYGHATRYRYAHAPRYVVRHDRWARGHRYRGPNYVVRDYGYYRLRPPPRGYHWVRANNDYLLVAIATGVILDIALH
jgi:Ni/Co efflux regulator RcnB